MPRVSIGVPVHDGEPFLESTLRSLLDQDFDDLEIVVCDNASSDRTEEICRSQAAADGRLRYERSDVNRGAAWNYNRVLSLARAPYFKWAAADDICRPTFVGRCVEMLDDGGPSVVIAYPRTVLVDAEGESIGLLDDDDLALDAERPADRLAQLLRHRLEWHPVFGVMRTDALRTTRGIGSFPMADVVLLAEMALRGKFALVPERLFVRRYHDKRSIMAGPSFVEQVAWYDPHRSVRFAMPQARLTAELLGAVTRSPLTPRARIGSAGAVLRWWTLPHWRHIGGEAKIALRSLPSSR